MITQILWLVLLPTIIYLSYKVIYLTLNYFEKKQH